MTQDQIDRLERIALEAPDSDEWWEDAEPVTPAEVLDLIAEVDRLRAIEAAARAYIAVPNPIDTWGHELAALRLALEPK